MLAAIDLRGIDSQPKRDHNPHWELYFIIFLIVGAFFLLELFLGVILENLNNLRDQNGRGLMTEAQKEWASAQDSLLI